MDAILTWISGDKFSRLPEVNAFLRSIEMLHFTGECVIFTHDMSLEIRKDLNSRGFEIVDVDPSQVKMVVRDRFLAIYKYLTKFPGRFKNILLVDSKDVIFQANPFNYAKSNNYIIFSSEGGTHRRSEWNAINQLKHQTNIQQGFDQDYLEAPILNSGVILGSSEEIKHLCMLIWSTSLSCPIPLSEQAALNYLWFYLKDNSNYTLYDPNNSLFAITGEGIIRNWVESPRYLNGKICLRETPYFVFHQWDRTLYKDIILETYK